MNRAELIEAMRRQYYGHEGAYERMLDAVLPLIADAIEEQGRQVVDILASDAILQARSIGLGNGHKDAARRVRSFLVADE